MSKYINALREKGRELFNSYLALKKHLEELKYTIDKLERENDQKKEVIAKGIRFWVHMFEMFYFSQILKLPLVLPIGLWGKNSRFFKVCIRWSILNIWTISFKSRKKWKIGKVKHGNFKLNWMNWKLNIEIWKQNIKKWLRNKPNAIQAKNLTIEFSWSRWVSRIY